MMLNRLMGLLLLVALLAGCSAGTATKEEIRILVIPSMASDSFEQSMTKLEGELARRTELPVKITIATDYASVVEAIRFGKADVGFFGPFTYVVANVQSGVQAFVTQSIKGSPYYHSYLIVPKDSPVTALASNDEIARLVKGKRVAFADAGSTSGSLVPRLALKKAGLDWEKDITYTFTGHHDAVLAAVAGNKADFGAIDSAIFEGNLAKKMPAEFAKVRVVWKSQPIYQYPWAARKEMDPKVVAKLQKAFLEIKDPAILAAFGADAFVKADDKLYAHIREAATEMGIDLQNYALKKK